MGNFAEFFVIVTGKICMGKHPFGHKTLFCYSEMEEMSLTDDGALG